MVILLSTVVQFHRVIVQEVNDLVWVSDLPAVALRYKGRVIDLFVTKEGKILIVWNLNSSGVVQQVKCCSYCVVDKD